MLTFVKYSNRIIVIGLESETKQFSIDFCQEKQLEVILDQLASECNLRIKDVFLVIPSQPDKEINTQKSLLG